MTINNGDVITQIITFTLGTGDEVQNKFTWKYTGNDHPDSGLIAFLDGWAEDFYELAAAYLKSAITAFISEYNKIEWDAVDEEWEVTYNIGTGSGSVTFTDTNEYLPFQVCPCLIGFTSRPKSRGRKFLPLFCEDAQSTSQWESAVETILTSMLAEYLETQVIETGKSLAPGVPSTVTGAFLGFLSGMVKDIVFTQRRRTRGRGS